MEGREYSNEWIATNDRGDVPEVMVVLSKWSPPRKMSSKQWWRRFGDWGPLHIKFPCWQDEVGFTRHYPYSKWKTTTGRVCQWDQGSHFASETFNLHPDNFTQPEDHWCYDASVSRTDLGILDYLNEKYAAGLEAEVPIIHIVVNSNDWGRSTISLDLAFPSETCDSHLPRFKDDVLFVGEYAKGQGRKGRGLFTGVDDGHGCSLCWDADELSMRVYSRHPASVAENSNGRRGSAMPISRTDVMNAKAAGKEWIIYDFSVEFVGGQKLRIAFPTWIMEEITGANWNIDPIKVYPALDS